MGRCMVFRTYRRNFEMIYIEEQPQENIPTFAVSPFDASYARSQLVNWKGKSFRVKRSVIRFICFAFKRFLRFYPFVTWTRTILLLLTHWYRKNISVFFRLFKIIFLILVLTEISLFFLSVGPIDNTSLLVQVMAWSQTSDQLLSVSLVTPFSNAYVCVTKAQRVNCTLFYSVHTNT